ncbi:unnamed protein product, partial [Gulo gulo]
SGRCQAEWLERAESKPPARARGGQRGGRCGSEARPPWLPAPRRSGQIRNNDSRPGEEEGSAAATLSLLLCTLRAPRACSLEKTWKAAFVLTATHHPLKKAILADDMQVLQDRIIAENLQRYSYQTFSSCLIKLRC